MDKTNQLVKTWKSSKTTSIYKWIRNIKVTPKIQITKGMSNLENKNRLKKKR